MLSSFPFGVVHASTCAAPLVALALLLAPVALVSLARMIAALMPSAPPPAQPVYRVARDGRPYVKIGRLCYWRRRGESFASIVNRYGL